MNIRKNIDYRAMFSALDMLIATDMPQMELYYEIGRLVSDRQEKGAAVAASEYLQSTYPDIAGFSPRSLRRMREFFCAYENAPDLLANAMNLSWTQNVAIFESGLTLSERAWYIRAALRFGWSKSVLAEKITADAHLSLDLVEEMCYTEKNDPARESTGSADIAAFQCGKSRNSSASDGLLTIHFLPNRQLVYRKVYVKLLLVCRRLRRFVGTEDVTGPPEAISRSVQTDSMAFKICSA